MTIFAGNRLAFVGPEDVVASKPSRVAIELRGITKRFGATVANEDASLSVRYGEAHALLGANGAGKTTLMSVLFGFVQPDEGAIIFNGERVDIRSPRDALNLGIGMVRQHFSLVPQLSVAENVVLGTHPATLGRIPMRELAGDIGALAAGNGMDLDPFRRVEQLDVDQQQAVEVLKLLYRGATVLLLDEPTASLGPAQVRRLFEVLSELRRGGRAVVIITHKLAEVMELADRATVMRAGRTVASIDRSEFDVGSLTHQMVGELALGGDLVDLEVSGAALVGAARSRETGRPLKVGSDRSPGSQGGGGTPGGGRVALRIRDLEVRGDRGILAVDHLDLDVPAGTIVGLAGVEGNGQRELVEALAGIRPPQGGIIEVSGVAIERPSPARMREVGLGVVSEDRLRWDVVPELSVADNLSLTEVAGGGLTRRGVLRRGALAERASTLIREYDIQPADENLPLRSLSGGNQQKVVIARELAGRPAALVASQPTRGLDLRATAAVHERLRWLKSSGGAVLLVTLDLDELLSLADRVVVLYRGRCAYEAVRDEVDLSQLSAAMAGVGAKQ